MNVFSFHAERIDTRNTGKRDICRIRSAETAVGSEKNGKSVFFVYLVQAAKQIFSLALLAQRQLSADELRSFLSGSYQTLEKALQNQA